MARSRYDARSKWFLVGLSLVFLVVSGTGILAVLKQWVELEALLLWAGGVGSLCSVFGIVVAIWQVLVARDHSKRAAIAADAAREAVEDVLLRVGDDIRSHCANEAIHAFRLAIDGRRIDDWASVSIRLDDCSRHIAELSRSLPDPERSEYDELEAELRRFASMGMRIRSAARKRFDDNAFAVCIELFWRLMKSHQRPIVDLEQSQEPPDDSTG